MKHFIVLAVLFLLTLAGCNSKSSVPGAEDNSPGKDSAAAVAPIDTSLLIGSYVGDFGANKITVIISKAIHDSVGGRSIVGVNNRPFAGTISKEGSVFEAIAKEPGDINSDGVFNFSFDMNKPEEISGNWTPNHPTKDLESKAFSLIKKVFKYSTDSGYYPEASKRLLNDSDLNNLAKNELDDMRNEIFARHGFCFRNKIQRDFYETQSWYIPISTDVRAALTDVEKKNITLIKKYAKYAADYGNDYGR